MRRLVTLAASLAALAIVALAASGAVAAPTAVQPKAGAWHSGSLAGRTGSGASGQFTITRISFSVSANHRSVSRFAFSYTYSGPIKPPAGTCSGSGVSSAVKSSSVKNARFSTPSATRWTGAASGTFSGTFTSARSAHGTARVQLYIGGAGCQLSGMATAAKVTWHASR